MEIKFEYFLNAIHYNIYLEEAWSNRIISKIVNGLFAMIFRIPFVGKHRKKHDGQKAKALDDFLYGNKAGLSIGVAHHWFGYLYSCYPAFLSFIFLGISFRCFGDISLLLIILIAAVPIGIFYIPAYHAVFSKDRYLKYFKQFENNDKQWQQKWKRITLIFCIGSIVTIILGLLSMWLIWLM